MPVPKLRFKDEHGQDYPKWKVNKLGELFVVSAGGDIDKNNVRSIKTQEFCYPVFANALKNNGLYGYSNTYKIDGESFTITGRGDVGVAVSRHCNYTPIVRLLVCQPLHNENVDFFAECFNKTRVYIESTGVPQLTSPQVKNIKVTYPSLPEQEKIADFLTSYDRMIDVQSQRVEAMKTRKKGLLQKIFSKEIRFKDDKGQDYPEWDSRKLSDVCDGFSSGQTPTSTNESYYNGDIPWLNSGELNRGIITTTQKKITLAGQKAANLKLLPKGTFLMAITGLEADQVCGNCGILGIESTVNQSCMYLFPRKNLNTMFLFQWYINYGKRLAKKYCQGTKQQSYNAEIVKNLDISIPSIPEQQKIANFMTAVDTQIEVEEKRLETMKTIKKGLLQQMFI